MTVRLLLRQSNFALHIFQFMYVCIAYHVMFCYVFYLLGKYLHDMTNHKEVKIAVETRGNHYCSLVKINTFNSFF